MLTTSSGRAFAACPRKYRFGYKGKYRPLKSSHALRFGTLIHRCLELYWRARKECLSRAQWLAQALSAIEASDFGWVDRTRARVMLRTYAAHWNQVRCRVVEVEVQYRYPLLRPNDGLVSDAWECAGKIDCILQYEDGRIVVLEHKTSSVDTGLGSAYRRRLTLDEQVSNYWMGAEALGYAPDHVVYDVLRKHKTEPYEATPEAERTYTKATKKNPEPRLHKGQHERDETEEEYEARLLGLVAENPGRWIDPIVVVRTELDKVRARRNVWALSRAIDFAETENVWFGTSDACHKFNKPCEFLDVCEGTARLTDPTKFYQIQDEHPELAEVEDDDQEVA